MSRLQAKEIAGDATPLRVLYIEDSPSDAELCLLNLKRAGFKITADLVATGAGFLEKLRSDTYDIILSDYRLPDWSGMEALQVAQKDAPDIPFILVTGTLGEEAAVECIKRGATDFVLKDRPARLPSSIRRALQERATRDEKRQAIEAHRRTEAEYRLLFDGNPHPMWVYDLETFEFVAVNETAAAHYGYSREEFLAMTIKEISPPDEVPAVLERIAQSEGVGDRKEIRKHRKKDGSIIDVELISHPVLFSGKRTELVLANDVTERKRAEEELAKLRKAVETSGEVVFMTDRAGVFIFVNPEFTRLYGYTAEEIVGKATPRILKSESGVAEDYTAFWKTILDKRVAKAGFTNKTKEGCLVDIEASANPILDEQGNIKGFLAIQRNITERRQLELQLRQAQKMEAVGRLAGGVAHDFNNLLTIINGYSEMLLDSASPGDAARGSLEQIKKAGERAAALTRQLLAFGRRQVLSPQVLDLNHVVADINKMLRRLIGEDIELVSSHGAELGRVKADAGQIEQVIMNLVVNARDAMPEGGQLTIETSNVDLDESYAERQNQMAPGSYVTLAVSDTGSGMDQETQAQIFEPFFTTKEKGKGTGLGLATVYGIVKQSGGFIWVHSEIGQGTTFKIYLPRVKEVAATVEPVIARLAPEKGSETILVVEDEESVRTLVRAVLGASGYTVLEASRGVDALTICEGQNGNIDLMLTDVVMPQMNGWELAKQLAKVRPDTKVLYMSGYTDNAIVHDGVLDPGTPFLQKPFSPDALTRKVREVLAA
ncbi:MAG TPA: PAS domain S-box protein [Terriglobia bacterium]|nr:PAS domain S-box protein [Terriglobia bacterium]